MKAHLAICTAVALMFASVNAFAQQCTPNELAKERALGSNKNAQTDDGHVYLVKGPSSLALQQALTAAIQAGLSSQTVRVKIEYDRSGHVISSFLVNPTRHRDIDQALVDYVKDIQLSPGACGTGYVPIVLNTGDAVGNANFSRENNDSCMRVIGIPAYCQCVSKELDGVTFDQYVTVLGRSKAENNYDSLTSVQKATYNSLPKIRDKCAAAH